MMFASCSPYLWQVYAIRDAQLAEKAAIRDELKAEEQRLDEVSMMAPLTRLL